MNVIYLSLDIPNFTANGMVGLITDLNNVGVLLLSVSSSLYIYMATLGINL